MEILFLECKESLDKDLMEEYKDIQILNSKYIAGRTHLEFALTQAKRAFDRVEYQTQR